MDLQVIEVQVQSEYYSYQDCVVYFHIILFCYTKLNFFGLLPNPKNIHIVGENAKPKHLGMKKVYLFNPAEKLQVFKRTLVRLIGYAWPLPTRDEF